MVCSLCRLFTVVWRRSSYSSLKEHQWKWLDCKSNTQSLVHNDSHALIFEFCWVSIFQFLHSQIPKGHWFALQTVILITPLTVLSRKRWSYLALDDVEVSVRKTSPSCSPRCWKIVSKSSKMLYLLILFSLSTSIGPRGSTRKVCVSGHLGLHVSPSCQRLVHVLAWV